MIADPGLDAGDGYAAYKQVAASKSAEGGITLAFCWSYVRRGFYDQAKTKTDYINRHAADVMFLLASAQELMLDKRWNFPDRSRSIMCEVISAEPYEGQCPHRR